MEDSDEEGSVLTFFSFTGCGMPVTLAGNGVGLSSTPGTPTPPTGGGKAGLLAVEGVIAESG